jgi:ABC-2 type transport system ATP-binding protein
MCPQSVVLWERLTCIEQLQFIGQMYGVGGGEARQRGERLLEELDLSDKRSTQARTLSGGMQRRLNLAMALVHDPEIVVLDEPEAGLDPQSRVKVREYIQSLARKKTIILTTHNMDEADRLVDRVAIIDHGELVVMDTPDALKRGIGEGDIVEIKLNGSTPKAELACKTLAEITPNILFDASSHALHIHALDAVGKLPVILETLVAHGIQPGEVSIRANTLEDVFIRLTGRRLRE